MARVSIWYVRAVLLHFLAGVSVGAWQLATPVRLVPVEGGLVRTVHIELLLVGWLVQLAFGVAVWILPFSRGVSSDRRLWGGWGALNGGLLLVVLGVRTESVVLELVGRGAEIGAVGAVLLVLWPRVRGVSRRDAGE